MKVCTIIGARPQFVKAAVVSMAFTHHGGVEEIIIHTGQHYDAAMSEIFFKELHVPHEKYNLGIGSGTHGEQTGRMLAALEKVLTAEKPDCTLVYGDTNSTLAGALASVKLHIPVAHVEAGMRSYNRLMPEEINRVVVDHLCETNFCSSEIGVKTLQNEGRGGTAILVGDVMYDSVLIFAKTAEGRRNPLQQWGLEPQKYVVLTCHRAENTDNSVRLEEVIKAANEISHSMSVLFPVHPRTAKYISQHGFSLADNVIRTPPLGYLDMLRLEKEAALILTDSGGIQKEAFFLGVPCITMRDETEWTETVDLGWNKITGACFNRIIEAVAQFSKFPPRFPKTHPYGDGNAAIKIVENLLH